MPQQVTRKVGDIVRVQCVSLSVPVWSFSNFKQKEFTEISSEWRHASLAIQVDVASRGIYECKGTTHLYSLDFSAQFTLTVMGKN